MPSPVNYSWLVSFNQPEKAMKVLNPENQLARSFRLTIGLQEGYEGGVIHTTEEVGQIIATWLREQKEQGRPYLPGTLTASTMYYWGRKRQELVTEPVVLFEGEVSPEHSAHLKDREVLAALTELSGVIASALRQERIYLRYRNRLLILQQEK